MGKGNLQTTYPKIELKQTQDTKSLAWCFRSNERFVSEGARRPDFLKIGLKERL